MAARTTALGAIAIAACLVGCAGPAVNESNTSPAAQEASSEPSETPSASQESQEVNFNSTLFSNADTSGQGQSVPANQEPAQPDAAAGSASAVKATQRVGNEATGYIDVPVGWQDRTLQDIGEEMASRTNATYVVDPESHYSPAASLIANGYYNAIQLEAYPTYYKTFADEKVKAYSENASYADTTAEDGVFAGHEAAIIATTVPRDRVLVTNIVFDPYDDGKSCIMITLYARGDTLNGIVSYAATWSAQKGE